MSSSVKRLLRSARECLGRKEYREALQHCKEALAEDKSCYDAYIFVGKAAFHLQELAQAEAAYRRASDLDPSSPLAWQGLAELYSEAMGSWAQAAECYARLLDLADAAPAEDPLKARRSTFARRLAEAHGRAGQLAAAEAAWRRLADAAEAALMAAGGGDGDGDGDGAVAAAEAELVDCLTHLADVQLAADAEELEVRVATRLAAAAEENPPAGPDQAAALEASVRGAVESEAAEEALELEADHASATLRRIIGLRPPGPRFAPYYDAFLKRLRKYIQAAPPGSMERHSRRALLLAAAKATMEGRCGERAGGCCSPYPYEATLALLEVEHDVVGSDDPSLDPLAHPPSPGPSAFPTFPCPTVPSAEPLPLPLLVADSGRVAAHLAHAFPWSPAARLHTALRLRRTSVAAPAVAAGPAVTVVARLPPAAAGGGAAASARPAAAAASATAAAVATATALPLVAAAAARHRQVVGQLLGALSGGARAVSGWLAACEMLLEEGAAQAALDAAKEGLKYVAARDLLGKERMAGAGLLLRLLAGRALLALGQLAEAELLLEGLAHGVSEGHVASGELAGIPPTSVSQQARRFLAYAAAARGDLAGARQRYDGLVGGQLMGRSAQHAEPWAAGELGMVLLREGNAEAARFYLQSGLQALPLPPNGIAAPAGSLAAAQQQEAAAYHLHLALALWTRAGGTVPGAGPMGQPAAELADAGVTPGGTTAASVTAAAERKRPVGPSASAAAAPLRAECREHLLAAAAVAGPLQAAAFAWLGHWYGWPPAEEGGEEGAAAAAAAAAAGVGTDAVKAARCYQRALMLDPNQAAAGEALVQQLVAAGRQDTALQLCEEMHAKAATAAATASASIGSPSASPSSSFTPAPAVGTPPLLHPAVLPVSPSALVTAPCLAPVIGASNAAVAAALGAVAGGAAGAAGGGTDAAAVGGVAGGSGGAGWALRNLARLQRDAGAGEAAVVSYQAALRLSPADAELWEGLASSYQALGRHTAALKSYSRALELSPGRLYSRLQYGALQYQMGDMPAALASYRTALAAAPNHPAALLGCGEVLLAQAALAARSGAAGAAAAELQEAAALAGRATALYGNMQAAWKLLADVRMQHGAVPTLSAITAARDASQQQPVAPAAPTASLPAASPEAAAAAAWVRQQLAAGTDRLAALRSTRRCYAAALHLDPRVAGLYGDLAMSYHMEVELAAQHPALQQGSGPSAPSASILRSRALALARGGLRLAPVDDWLWACTGAVAAAAATAAADDGGGGDAVEAARLLGVAEYCWSRCLQLNPRRAGVWAALGRLYATHGEGGLASKCFDAARSHEPTSIAVWEAMGDSALRRSAAARAGSALLTHGGQLAPHPAPLVQLQPPAGDPALRDAADAYEHAQLLGGDAESRLAFVLLGNVLHGGNNPAQAVATHAAAAALPGGAAGPSDGVVLAAGAKAAAMQPLLPAAHQARALALEARGDCGEAVQALHVALALLDEQDRCLQQPPAEQQRAARTAMRLDLLRCLAAAGRAADAISLYGSLLSEGAVREDDAGSRLSYATALQQAGRTEEALAELQAVLSSPQPTVTPPLRLAAAAAALRIHVAARRWDEAYGVVLAATSDMPQQPHGADGAVPAGGRSGAVGGVDTSAVAQQAADLWLTLLAGLVSARAPELEAELLGAMRGWTAGRRDLDGAQHECRVQELLAAKAATAQPGPNGALAALRHAARAVHTCPNDRAARALLASAALTASPTRAAAASRAAPRNALHSAAAPLPSVAAKPTAVSLPAAASAPAAHAVGVLGRMPYCTAEPLSAEARAAVAAGVAGGPYGGGAIGGGAVCTAAGGVGADEVVAVAVRAAVGRLRGCLHAQPQEAAGWFLAAMTELQLAAVSGDGAHHYRRAGLLAKAAAAHAAAELAALPSPPPSAAAAAPPAPVLPGLPVMALMAKALAEQAARAHAGSDDPRVGALRAQRAALADLAVRALAALSECHLRGRALGGAQKAREAAEGALRFAAEHGADASHAHRQLARVHLTQGDWAAADAAYDQACRAAASHSNSISGGGGASAAAAAAWSAGSSVHALLPVLERAAARAMYGSARDAVQLLAGAPEGRATGTPTALAEVQRSLMLLQLGEVEAARAAAAAAVDATQVVGVGASGGSGGDAAALAGVRSSAHTLMAAAALCRAAVEAEEGGGAGPEAAAARKKSLLEARWAAREALKPLTQARPVGPRVKGAAARAAADEAAAGPAGPGAALATLVLSKAEAALGKADGAAEAAAQVARLWPKCAQQPCPVEAVAVRDRAASTAGAGAAAGEGGSRLALVRELHRRPWALGPAWSGLVAAAKAG